MALLDCARSPDHRTAGEAWLVGARVESDGTQIIRAKILARPWGVDVEDPK